MKIRFMLAVALVLAALAFLPGMLVGESHVTFDLQLLTVEQIENAANTSAVITKDDVAVLKALKAAGAGNLQTLTADEIQALVSAPVEPTAPQLSQADRTLLQSLNASRLAKIQDGLVKNMVSQGLTPYFITLGIVFLLVGLAVVLADGREELATGT